MKVKLFSFNMGKKKTINNPKKSFRLQFLFYTLVFINFLFCDFFYGEKFKREKKSFLLKKNEHLGFQA